MSKRPNDFREDLRRRLPRAWLTLAMTVGSMSASAGPDERVTRLPTSRIFELRARLQAELRGDLDRRPVDKLVNLGVGRSRTGLIAVEEASTFLDDHREGSDGRVRRVMGLAERILDETTLNEVERSTLRGYLNLHLQLFKAYLPRAAIQMLYRHHLWTVDHLPYILSQTNDVLGRQMVYRALVDLRLKMTADQVAILVHHLRANPPLSIERLAMLDEFDRLDENQYASLVKRLQMSFCEPSGGLHRSTAQEIRLRALARIQSRVLRKDPATLWALRKAAGQPGSVLGAIFFRRLEAGNFEIDLSPVTLTAADPLRLRELPSSNVIAFDCARRLDSARSK